MNIVEMENNMENKLNGLENEASCSGGEQLACKTNMLKCSDTYIYANIDSSNETGNKYSSVGNIATNNNVISIITRDKVLQQLNIATIIQTLRPDGKKNGQEYICLCPFHNDHNPSLSINLKSGIYFCHACKAKGSIFDLYSKINRTDFKGSFAALKELAGLTSNDSFNQIEVDRHDYLDADGNLLYQRVRIEPGDEGRSKKYLFCDPKNKSWKRPCDPVLYNLPAVIESSKVIICEGERKADVLNSWGLVGTSFDSGANSTITDAMIEVLSGKDIVILPDNDDSGQNYCNKIIKAIQNNAGSIKVVHLPDLDVKGDIVDWIQTSGNDKERLLSLIEQTSVWESDSYNCSVIDSNTVSATVLFEIPNLLTDQRLKKYFNHVFKNNVQYVPGIGWHFWDGKRWCTDQPGGLYPLIDQMQRYLLVEADKIFNEKERIEFKKSLIGLESHNRQTTLIQACQQVPDLITSANNLDADVMMLNCQNGTINLTTGTLKQHDPSDLITRIVELEYDPSATCPSFMKFITWAMCDNLELVSYLQRFIGYSLTGKTSEQILNFWYGTGGNGKTTLMNVFQWILGDYSTTADTSLIMKRNNGGSDGNRLAMFANLRGARFVTLSEVNDGEKLDEAAIKSFTGGDIVTCRHLYKDFFTFVPQAKLVGFGNYKPHVRGTDNGIWRRIHLVPFEAEITEDEKDALLPDKLKDELSGILAWAVRGCLEWQRIGLAPPKAILDAVKEYRENEDVFQSWLNDCCLLDNTKRTSAADLISSFINFSGWKSMSNRKFGDMLKERGFEKMRSNGVHWIGISLLDMEQLEPSTINYGKYNEYDDYRNFPKLAPKVPTVPNESIFDFS
ncbi:MAG: phage/plasmid primase, P4 family [Legionella sp.]|uniref:phage/plasmid primase, P4 family n=1 Tax=Legionella sp. TaxID=459 RepID=UPI00284978CD|nr:phage/plasmid primase, P4 family [Legionella sp.]